MSSDEGQGGGIPPAGTDGQGTVHVPVLLREVMDALCLAPGLLVVDGTAGAAGHGLAIARAIAPGGLYVGLDRDRKILDRAASALRGAAAVPTGFSLHPVLYSQMGAVLASLGRTACDRVLLDIGASSMQLDSPERGFSFQVDGPLDMRMDQGAGAPLSQWLAQVSEEELGRVLREYGEERYWRRIASAIVAQRETGGLHRTLQLAEIVRRAIPGAARQRIHPATRTFQALRIAINDELGELERGLVAANTCLSAGGRLVVITFHSLEDRIVKRFLRAEMELPFRKPITASATEVARNPRARSAKLRCGIKRREAAA
jgi:16S rRNA (cytosine1402-N4)-methyltransferase